MSSENNLENEIGEAAENIQEEATEVVETVDDTVKEAVDETVNEAVEEVTETVEEATEAAEENVEEVTEAAEENVEGVAEAAEEKAEEVTEAVKTPAKQTKAAPVIKKKKGINKTTLIVLIVCAVIVLACVWFVGFKLGWWQKNVYTIAAHDTIELPESTVDITDEEIDSYVTRFQDAYSTTEEVTTGKVEDGDTVYISYVGKIDGEEFDGGSSDGYELTIGSGTFIDGFEDGLVGVKVGDTVDLDLTFPEDYSSEDVAGKDVTFTVTVIHKDVTETPEFTDEFVKENSNDFCLTNFGDDVQIDTVDDFNTYIHDYLYDRYLESALETELDNLITVKSYDKHIYDTLYEYGEEQLNYYASYYGMDTDTIASYYGYESADAYNKETTEAQMRQAMLYSDLAKEIGITHTDEDIDAELTKYMEDNGLSESYTLEEFKEINGEGWLYMYKNYEMNYEPVIEAMKERVVFVPDAEEETSAEETTTE